MISKIPACGVILPLEVMEPETVKSVLSEKMFA